MFLHEAVKRALDAPSVIFRESEGDKSFLMVAQNPRELIYVGAAYLAKVGYGWEPSASDLIADDWVVKKANGIEWPVPAPSEAQRKWKRFLKHGTG